MILEGIKRPIIAALGDLSGAIDWHLVKKICQEFPDHSIVFIGHRIEKHTPPINEPNFEWISEDPALHFDEIIGHIDVIICPYKRRNGIDARIFGSYSNLHAPYFIPVVTTGWSQYFLTDNLFVAKDRENEETFIDAIKQAIKAPKSGTVSLAVYDEASVLPVSEEEEVKNNE